LADLEGNRHSRLQE